MADITEFPIATKEFDPTNFQGPAGEDGREIELRINNDNLEWRYVGDVSWTVLPLESITINDFAETEYETTNPALNRVNGSIQILTLAAPATPTVTLPSGKGMLLVLKNGNTQGVNWASAGITWIGGSEPTLTNNDHINLYNILGVKYGSYIGAV